MVDAIKTFFIAIGVFTVGFMVYISACTIINKFNRWRKNGCKIKCLCKPHKYKLIWYWRTLRKLFWNVRNAVKKASIH